MEAGSIFIDLDLGHHVDESFSAQLGAALRVDGDILVLAQFFVVDGHRAVDAALLDHPFDERIETRLAIDVADDGKIEVRALDDVEGEADQRSLHFLVGILRAGGLLRQVVDIRDALVGDGDIGHGHRLKIGNATAQGAEDHEGVARGPQVLRELRRAHEFEFFGAEEDRVVVQGFHDSVLALLTELAERRLDDLVVLLEGIEEGLDDLHLCGHGVEAQALGGQRALVQLLIEELVLGDVGVFVEEEVAEVHQEVGRNFAGNGARNAFDDEVALKLAGDGNEVVVASQADDAVAEGFVGIAPESDGQEFLGRTDFFDGMLDFFNGAFEDFAGNVKPPFEHACVGVVHNGHFAIDFAREDHIVDFGAGLGLAGRVVETRQVLEVGIDVGLVEELDVATVAEAEAQLDGTFGFGGTMC